jgi:hypothetical protein
MPDVIMHHGAIILTKRHREHGGAGVDELYVISGAVVVAGVRIHQKLGPGLLESVYEVVLARDLVRLGFRVERQRAVSLTYLKIMNLRLGLLMNFGMATMKAGTRRLANGAGHAPWPRAFRDCCERCPFPAQALL